MKNELHRFFFNLAVIMTIFGGLSLALNVVQIGTLMVDLLGTTNMLVATYYFIYIWWKSTESGRIAECLKSYSYL